MLQVDHFQQKLCALKQQLQELENSLQGKSFEQPDNHLEIVISKQKPDAIVPKPLALNEKSSYDEEFTFVSHNKV